jgi:outer membrane protein assembly factor BamB/tetratricopeptide (TPR) repeat protein
MSFKGDLSTIGLAEVFQMISMSQKEGTLVVQDADSRKCIFFGATGVELLSSGRRKGMRLGDMLVRAGKISEAQVEEALENARIMKALLGEVLVENGIVTREEIQQVVREQIEEEIYDLFLWQKANFEFIEGPPPDNLKDPEAHVTKLTFDVNGLLLEAVRRADEWTIINQHIPTLDAIFAFSSDAIREEEEAQASDQQRRVFRLLDGRISVLEIAEGTGVSKFEVCRGLVDLMQRERVRVLSVQESIAEAERRIAEGQRERGLKLYMACATLAPGDAKVAAQVARFLEGEGLSRESAGFHTKAAQAYLEQGDLDRAMDHVQRAEAQNPDDLGIRFTLFEIHAASGNLDEGKSVARALIPAALASHDFARPRALVERILKASPEDMEFHVLYAKVLHRSNLRKEAEAEIAWIDKNLPVDPGAADKIQRDLREVRGRVPTAAGAGKPSASKPGGATTTTAPVAAKGGGGKGVWIVLAVLLLGLGGGGGYYELTQRKELDGVLEAAERKLEGSDFDGSRKLVDDFQKRSFSPMQKDRAREFGLRVDERQEAWARTEKERAEKDREALARRMTELLAVIVAERQTDPAGALAKARQLRELAEGGKDVEMMRKAEDLLQQLERFLSDAFQLKVLADAQEKDGRFREAALLIDRLIVEFPNTDAARGALYPLEIVTRPSGVKVSTRTGLVLGETPLRHRLRPGESVRLIFERDGYGSVDREIKDKTLGRLSVDLVDKKAAWVLPLGVTNESDPVQVDDTLFVAGGNRLYALKTDPRKLDWFESFDSKIEGRPTVGEKRTYVATSNSMLYALDPRRASGRIVWKYDAKDRLTGTPGLSGDGGIVFVGTYDRQLHAVHGLLGELLWKRELPGEMRVEPIWANGALIVGCGDGTLMALQGPRAGDELWRIRLEGAPGPLTFKDGLLYLMSSDNTLSCIDTARGQRLWKRRLSSSGSGAPRLVRGNLVVAGRDGRIVFLDARVGEPLWSYEAGGGVLGGVQVAGDLVLFGSEDQHFYALDVATKSLAWKCRTGGRIRTGASIGGGMIFFMSEESLYAVKLN